MKTKVMKVDCQKKSLYGLKQAHFNWNNIHRFLNQLLNILFLGIEIKTVW